MTFKELKKKLLKISDIYAKKFSVERTPEWYLLKLEEEVGELSAAHLKLSGRGRAKDKTEKDLRKNLEDEIADVLAMTLLFAQNQGVDVERALKKKWFKYLEK